MVRFVHTDGIVEYQEIETDEHGCFETFVVSADDGAWSVTADDGAWSVTAEYPGSRCDGPATAGPRTIVTDFDRRDKDQREGSNYARRPSTPASRGAVAAVSLRTCRAARARVAENASIRHATLHLQPPTGSRAWLPLPWGKDDDSGPWPAGSPGDSDAEVSASMFGRSCPYVRRHLAPLRVSPG